ncbi:MAG: SMC-Scp complex subunit ScpB [Candidatus Bathyarchaeota archaeon]|nr:SMC-Scp complex subunit ScpB [Candidatus Bathyarchaeota archaeon]MDH5786700.1 SMC-Scp complex subunit ScpB [Candidatus Bathyarchaeota archaeon]
MQKAEKQAFDVEAALQQARTTEKMQHDLALVEAALYVAGRPLGLNELCSVLKTRSKKKAKKLAKMLMQGYSGRKTALEILELKDERYVLQLKTDFTPHVRKLVKRPLLSTGPLKTLSYIAYRQPVSQKRVVEVRGHHVYGHIKMLKEMSLVASERSGRSSVLRTTEYFADYFALSHDKATMKKELKHVFEDFSKQEKP